jgi:hypothetical protein
MGWSVRCGDATSAPSADPREHANVKRLRYAMLAGSVIVALGADASDQPAPQGPGATALSRLFRAAEAAMRAFERNDAAGLLAAVREMRSVPIAEPGAELSRVRTQMGDGDATSLADPLLGAGDLLDLAALLRQAREMSDDAKLQSRIDALADLLAEDDAKTRPVVACAGSRVEPGREDVWRVTAPARSWVGVTVLGDLDTRLACTAFDQKGGALGKSGENASNCHLEWWTRHGGAFEITVANRSRDTYNDYRVCTNPGGS